MEEIGAKDTLDEPQPSATYRKHSSGDLHSRLKTRKILGVGETDNGDIHRSKISQLLGHNEHLYVKFPRGFWLWHLSMALTFTFFGFKNMFFPGESSTESQTEDASPTTEDSTDSGLSTRLYGSMLLVMAFLLWSFWGTMDKGIARTMLLAIALCQFLQVVAIISSEWGHVLNWRTVTHLLLRTFLITPNGYFYRNIGFCGLRMRKSTSFNNLRDCIYNSHSSSNSGLKKSD